MDPTSKLLVVVDVGSRTLAMAQRVVHQVTQVLAPGCVPLFLTDGLKEYATALLTHFGQWMQPERRQDKGPMPKPRWMPLPELLYAQVVKSYRRRRIVGVTAPRGVRHPAGHRAGLGGLWLDDQYGLCRAAQPRHPPARGGDRTPGQYAVPGRSGLAGSVGAVPGLSQLCACPTPVCASRCRSPKPPTARGSAKVWRPCTPAMAAGLTDHVWSLKEVLFYRVPPWPQPQTV